MSTPKQHTEATRMASSTTTAPATAPWTASKNSTLSTPLPRKLRHKVCLLWDVRTPIHPFPCHVAYCVQPFQNAVRPNVLLQTWKVAKLYSAAVFLEISNASSFPLPHQHIGTIQVPCQNLNYKHTACAMINSNTLTVTNMVRLESFPAATASISKPQWNFAKLL